MHITYEVRIKLNGSGLNQLPALNNDVLEIRFKRQYV